MLNFPLPYKDELVYSLVARAGVHRGITSPKQLLDEIFGNRHVISTVDLPNQLEKILRWLPDGQDFSVENLAYRHSLFPIYAPFASEDHRKNCLKKMASDSKGTVHLALGVAASRVKQPVHLRYCPGCLSQQLHEHGEYYWIRQWQIAGFDVCKQHGQLIETNIDRHLAHRHQFVPASPDNCGFLKQKPPEGINLRISRQIEALLSRGPTRSAKFEQWTCYYRHLAADLNCGRGKQVKQEAILERINGCWPISILQHFGLLPMGEGSWLQAMFRKHRKAFSYLEHIIVLHAFLDNQWNVEDVLDEVSAISCKMAPSPTSPAEDIDNILQIRQQCRDNWLLALSMGGIKRSRTNNSGLYAWLYRNDKEWLLNTNKAYHLPKKRENRRVDWQRRDFSYCRKLIRFRHESSRLPKSPRRSRNWYLSFLSRRSMIEKNLDKLPLVSAFFAKNCETVEDYQIRRLQYAKNLFESNGFRLVSWLLLRYAGLSDERLTGKARNFLNNMDME